MKKMDTSKKIFLFVSMLVIVITLFTIVAVWHTGDVSPLSILIPSCFAEFATATGFYYWKAKNENIQKNSSNSAQNDKGMMENVTDD